MFSLEAKGLDINQKKQVTGATSTNILFSIEVYYFNQKLSFFEPAIEKVDL